MPEKNLLQHTKTGGRDSRTTIRNPHDPDTPATSPCFYLKLEVLLSSKDTDMEKIKNVVFDLGGVLVGLDFDRCTAAFAVSA